MPEYAFDVKCFIAVRVNAATENEARKMVAEALNCADANLGAWPDGKPILAELSADGEFDLYEVDGEFVD